MGKAGSRRPLIARADIVSDANRIGGCAMIFGENHPKTVVQFEFFEGDVERLGRLGGGLIVVGFCAPEQGPGNNRYQDDQSRDKSFCCFHRLFVHWANFVSSRRSMLVYFHKSGSSRSNASFTVDSCAAREYGRGQPKQSKSNGRY